MAINGLIHSCSFIGEKIASERLQIIFFPLQNLTSGLCMKIVVFKLIVNVHYTELVISQVYGGT
jgi:hypothetical protein